MPDALAAGLGLKPEHFEPALSAQADGLWFEVHPENYMVAGGPRLRWLEAIRSRHPVALHGVSLSLAGDAPLDADHLQRLAALARRIEPALISEHLAWSRCRGRYFPDLLPFPRTTAALRRIAANIARCQDALGRTIAIENPAHYLRLDGHDWDEIDFLSELARRTSCALLLDINNVYVSARNLAFCAEDWLDRFPQALVSELHLAGHGADASLGEGLLIDSHDAPVAPPIWRLYRRFLERAGARPTLIERDGNLPAFDELMAERNQAMRELERVHACAFQPQHGQQQDPVPVDRPDPGTRDAVAPGGTEGKWLGHYQALFAQAVLASAPAACPALQPILAQPGFAVYRNTVMKACIDALQANFPTVARLVGSEWFRAAAALYVGLDAPVDARLLCYGNGFCDFLRGFAPAAELGYLPGVARLDSVWREVHGAPDAFAIDAAWVSRHAPEQLASLVLWPHPAARWAWFEGQPIYSIWARNRSASDASDADEGSEDLIWRSEGALLTRPRDAVLWHAVTQAGCAFLDACASGKTLCDASACALEVDPQTDIATLFATLLRAGAFVSAPPGHCHCAATSQEDAGPRPRANSAMRSMEVA